MFDAECDLAAIVYGAQDDPDRVMLEFTRDLCDRGGRPVGVIQLGRSCRAENPGLQVVMLPDGGAVELAASLAPHSTGCRLASSRLADVAGRLAAEIDAGADLVVINRFGRSEADGEGLIDLIGQALGANIPVLIAVPEQRFAAWITFSGGMNVRLECRREALDRWWRSVSAVPPPHRIGDAATFCELAK
jgi:hypothetical protein